MTRNAKPKLVSTRPSYVPELSERERAAYAAAHRIMTEQAPIAELACPGARRSKTLDHIARIIIEAVR